ncbi:MAG: serine/threonine-protein phosphatase [Clostridiales bacterium]|nr:serine/threonine-protein phosphatase [Clostridiales bacterium]
MAFYSASEKNRRSVNEDSHCHMELRINLEASVSAMVVADGMGGLSAGKFYSEVAMEMWYRGLLDTMMGSGFRDCSLHQQIDSLEDFSENIFEKVNRQLYKKGLDTGAKGGTTLSAAIHFWDMWLIANCGDSPVYGMKNGKLFLLSEIQNVASQMVKKGMTKEGSTLFYQNKNRLTEYLGERGEIHPHFRRVTEGEIDAILMGSDGAFGNLSMKGIENILNSRKMSQQTLKELFEQARATGEEDNQTAVLYVGDKKKPEDFEEEINTEFFQNLKLDDSFQDHINPFCSYTKVPEDKEMTLKEKLLRRCRPGGKER